MANPDDPLRQDGPAAGDGIPARQAALVLVESALSRRGGFEEAVALPAFQALPPSDRGFARALALATLRRLGGIDAVLDTRLKKAPPLAVRHLLRLALAQRWGLDTPAFAAVATTVRMAERGTATRPYKGLINAVLRGLERAPIGAPDARWAPDWLMARWRASWGDDRALGIARAIPQEPPTDLSLKPEEDAAAVAEAVGGEVLPGGSVRTPLRGDVATWPGFTNGGWWVQDAAAALPARLLDARPGERVLDLCAAPGGKTLQLAATGATVTALDRSAPRLRRLRQNLERTGLEAAVIEAEGEAWAAANPEAAFDAVLLDAPCSATGTFRRHPDVLWASRPADIGKLADVQHRLLDAAAGLVRPGGRLVYCVCSLEREEGESQIIAFLRRHPEFVTEAADPAAIGAPAEAMTPEGWLRVLPSQWAERGGLDGFFAARLVRGD